MKICTNVFARNEAVLRPDKSLASALEARRKLADAASVVSAEGALSSLAWGNAPGLTSIISLALKARLKPSNCLIRDESRCQRYIVLFLRPGALPQAINDAAPLALDKGRAEVRTSP
jgi:hypothetical protein